jgi:phenylacetate-CoA ligase
LCGVPSQILKLLEYFHQHRDEYKKIKIEKVLFGGEALYPDQYEAYHQIIPTLKISSIGIASVDGGLIGYTSKDCEVGEQRVFSEATVIEIVDVDTGEIITEKYKTGKILLTNLTRKLMPIIRYPAGDLAMWVEDETVKDRKFKLMGRSDEAARLGTISVYFEDTRKLVTETLSDVTGIQFQMKLEHFDHKDSLTLVIAGHNLKEESGVIEKILNAFIKDKKVYSEVLNKGLIHPLKIKIVKMEELESNVRTGKLKRVIDTRI